jgi:small ligand-binding sensory domain FIST
LDSPFFVFIGRADFSPIRGDQPAARVFPVSSGSSLHARLTCETLTAMKLASALSTKSDLVDLVGDLAHQIRSELGPEKVELALLFAHPQLANADESFLSAVRHGIGARHLIGCTGSGIIGDREECEQEPAVSVLVAQLPGVEITPFHVTQEDLEEASGPASWHFNLEVEPDSKPNFLMFIDPFSTQSVSLVKSLAEAYPGAPLVGGLSSGGRQPGDCRLFMDDQVLTEGAVGVALAGAIELRTIVSQGCRPIGQPLTITKAERNVIFELAGRPPMTVLQEMLPQLPASDQKLARTALFLGRVINEYQEDFGRGDFLIRNLLDHDSSSGALAVNDWMRTGQTVQFQVRDGSSAAVDLNELLRKERERSTRSPVRGAVIFSCLGRGEGMYGERNHDIRAVQEGIGPVPAAGFFANGEIGPVGAETFVHGFTSVIGLFAEPGPAKAGA